MFSQPVVETVPLGAVVVDEAETEVSLHDVLRHEDVLVAQLPHSAELVEDDRIAVAQLRLRRTVGGRLEPQACFVAGELVHPKPILPTLAGSQWLALELP